MSWNTTSPLSRPRSGPSVKPSLHRHGPRPSGGVPARSCGSTPCRLPRSPPGAHSAIRMHLDNSDSPASRLLLRSKLG